MLSESDKATSSRGVVELHTTTVVTWKVIIKLVRRPSHGRHYARTMSGQQNSQTAFSLPGVFLAGHLERKDWVFISMNLQRRTMKNRAVQKIVASTEKQSGHTATLLRLSLRGCMALDGKPTVKRLFLSLSAGRINFKHR